MSESNRKIDEINKFLSENIDKNKEDLIINICLKFNVTEKSAQIYYRSWKKQYMNSNNCIPKELNSTKNIVVYKHKKKIKVPHDKEIIDVKNKSVFKKFNKKGELIEGTFGNYIVIENSVVCDDVVFESESDVEEYKKKSLKLFYAQLGEILELLDKRKKGEI